MTESIREGKDDSERDGETKGFQRKIKRGREKESTTKVKDSYGDWVKK